MLAADRQREQILSYVRSKSLLQHVHWRSARGRQLKTPPLVFRQTACVSTNLDSSREFHRTQALLTRSTRQFGQHKKSTLELLVPRILSHLGQTGSMVENFRLRKSSHYGRQSYYLG